MTTNLAELFQRRACASCGKPESLYCKLCALPVIQAPHIELPLPLHVYRHPLENIGKTTSIHAKALASPVQITVTPALTIAPRTLLLFPSKDARFIDEIPLDDYDSIAVIDGTWRQARSMLKGLPGSCIHAKLRPHKTDFWRFQSLGPEYLATIEAIYWIYVERFQLEFGRYDQRFDSLLYFFKLNYDLIQNKYQNSEKTFTVRHGQGPSYILDSAKSIGDSRESR